LPSVRELSNSSYADAPKLLPKQESIKRAKAQVVETILGKNNSNRSIQTPLEPVIIQKDLLLHIIKKRSAARERYANFIIPSLADPNEIWLTSYDDGFRRRFIKLFKGKKNMLVIVRENLDGSLLWNVIPAESTYINRQRTGVLLYEK